MKRQCVYCEVETMFVNLRVPRVKLQNTRKEHNLKCKRTNVVQYESPASFWKVRIKIMISVGMRLAGRLRLETSILNISTQLQATFASIWLQMPCGPKMRSGRAEKYEF
jgi:hypothetical protein